MIEKEDIDIYSLGFLLIPDFITAEEEAELLENIGPINSKKTTKGRNTIKRYGSILPYSSNMVSSNIPPYLDKICDKIFEAKLVEAKPDSVTVNEYLVGQAILPHVDSQTSGPIITVLSLKSAATMNLTKGRAKVSVELLPRSLIQMKGDIRDKWMHGIDAVKEDRFSVVFRQGTKRQPIVKKKKSI